MRFLKEDKQMKIYIENKMEQKILNNNNKNCKKIIRQQEQNNWNKKTMTYKNR